MRARASCVRVRCLPRRSIVHYSIASSQPAPPPAPPTSPAPQDTNQHSRTPSNRSSSPTQGPSTTGTGKVSPASVCSGDNFRANPQPLPVLTLAPAHQPSPPGRTWHTKERPKCAFLLVMTEILQNNPIVVSFTGSKGNDTRREMQDSRHGLQDTPHFTSPGAPQFSEQGIALPPAQAFHTSTPKAKKNRSSIEKAHAIPALAQNPEGGWLLLGHIMKIIRRRLRPALSFYMQYRGGRGVFSKPGAKNWNRIGAYPKNKNLRGCLTATKQVSYGR